MGERVDQSITRWYEQMPDRWRIDQEIARRFMDHVNAGIDNNGLAFITGTFSLTLNSGHVLDGFSLRILYPHNYPLRNCHPEVYLESHRDRWQTGRDSHIEPSWRLCLFIPLESGLYFEREGELANLFPLIQTFLMLERMYQRKLQLGEKNPIWPGPQRGHGTVGLIDALGESGARPGRNDPCACGSGKKFKKCCGA